MVFYLFAPETRGRTLEDIDAIFLASEDAFQPPKHARTMPIGVAEEVDLSEKVGVHADEVEEKTA